MDPRSYWLVSARLDDFMLGCDDEVYARISLFFLVFFDNDSSLTTTNLRLLCFAKLSHLTSLPYSP